MTTNEFIAQKPSEADVGLYSWEDNVVKDLESENAAKGQVHHMFSRIFRIRIYECFIFFNFLYVSFHFSFFVSFGDEVTKI